MFVLALMLVFTRIGIQESCTASWYGRPFHGRLTASGTIYDMNEMTCAHCTLPLGTIVLFHNPQNGRWDRARVTNRGPYNVYKDGKVVYPLEPHPDRQFDLSRALFDSLTQGNLNQGLVDLEFWVIGRNTEGLQYNL